MRAMALAMTTEYCRRGWRVAAGLVFGSIALLVFLAREFSLNRDVWGFFHFFWGSAFLFCTIIVFTAQCDPVQAESRCQLRLPRWLFVLPVPTWALVGWQMLLGTLSAGSMYAVLAGLFGYFLGVDWPIWIPAVVFSAPASVNNLLSQFASSWDPNYYCRPRSSIF